jgi:hypothetical protein
VGGRSLIATLSMLLTPVLRGMDAERAPLCACDLLRPRANVLNVLNVLNFWGPRMPPDGA